MIKYLNVETTFAEVPDEIALCINITGCPCHCPGCHSKFLWEDTGIYLGFEEIDKIIADAKGISCLCFMGGDQDTSTILSLAEHVRYFNPNLKIAWYSGREEIPNGFTKIFDYIKLGPYIEKYGGLNKKTTNQRMYRIDHTPEKDFVVDITCKFLKKIE